MTTTNHTPTPHGVDLTGLDDDQLRTLSDDVDALLRARWRMATASVQAEQIAQQYHEDREAVLPPLAEGEHRAWVQPLGGHDAYPRGYVVAHGGKVWRSNHPANVWEPGGAGTPAGLWKDVTSDAPAPGPAPNGPVWKAGQAVKADDVRTYRGDAYTVIQPHTTQTGWEPPAAPSLWKKV